MPRRFWHFLQSNWPTKTRRLLNFKREIANCCDSRSSETSNLVSSRRKMLVQQRWRKVQPKQLLPCLGQETGGPQAAVLRRERRPHMNLRPNRKDKKNCPKQHPRRKQTSRHPIRRMRNQKRLVVILLLLFSWTLFVRIDMIAFATYHFCFARLCEIGIRILWPVNWWDNSQISSRVRFDLFIQVPLINCDYFMCTFWLFCVHSTGVECKWNSRWYAFSFGRAGP